MTGSRIHQYHISKAEKDILNSTRDTPWRQGQVIASNLVPALEEGRIAVIITHDCDIPHHSLSEVEYIAGLPVEKADKQFQRSRHARQLHIDFETRSGQVQCIQLQHQHTAYCPKSILDKSEPDENFRLSDEEKRSLKQWLVAKYGRPAYPNEFENRLKSAGVERKLRKKVEKVSQFLTGVFFHLGAERSKELPVDEPYFLGISIVYDGLQDVPESREAAIEAAKEIDEIFKIAFDGKNENSIVLDKCNAIADTQFSVADLRTADQWRLEFLSLEDSDDPVILTANHPV